eukprot:TRINITY_DN17528_c0_g1_i1.p1 TRINITY_DN17528_c0_g1~~TRINITY_DN17528_c0_g1_i1.p1  ORF type:complete len:340 (-),score=64.12 TRINITY_DN17528_c0_g1_i1:91-1110(-)
MASFVQSYGLELKDRAGQPFDTQQLTSSDVIAFYFSAHWCPPCRQFTPLLKKFFETLRSNGDQSLKIIFVSSDETEHDMWKYMYDCHGDWFVLSYSCRELKDRLSRQFQVSGIPQLIVIDGVGRQAVRDARGDVMSAASMSSTQVLTTFLNWKLASGATGQASSSGTGMLAPESRVRIRGLTGAPEHNGKDAIVKSFNAEKKRYVLEFDERQLSLKAANLLQLLAVKVRPPKQTESEEWTDAEMVDFDEASSEFVLRLGAADGEAETIRATLADIHVLRLEPGAIVSVQNLQAESAKQWNDQNGKVLEFDTAASRYLIQVAPNTNLKIRPENLRFCPLS